MSQTEKKIAVTLYPTMQVLHVDSEKTLLPQLLAQGIFIKSSCGGHASCGDCKIKVRSGEDFCQSPPFAEIKLLGNVFHLTKERLSCQLKIIAPVTIDITEQLEMSHLAKIDGAAVKHKKKKSNDVKRRSAPAFNRESDKRVQPVVAEKSNYSKPASRDNSDSPWGKDKEDFNWKKGGFKRPKRSEK